ncbi:SDR family oxidoreductase [Frigoribacterium sp. CFBP 13729]|uniref:SDR family NAD(P)-dependent oxidoreductase n=1 Tax=unclassified Frigoribacterium TaxID=2627005 RepID=UPI00177DF2FF|nr:MULTISPECIES: SDR family oxidoreductase [unclassified Frigoribacterium]MBD8585599.1 SDR family oxidoreductase [Frigoribacterium sp. CFBP 8766]MBD8611703.1 SDR family oxidoreductase [Frigoribacterium sp. CFBP 13729]
MKSNDEELQTLTPDTRLAGTTALVTGSTSGIGEAIVRVLAASGAEVVVSGRDASRAASVVRAVTEAGGRAHAVVGDLGGSPTEVRRVAAEAEAALGGRVDVLVNNAGIYPAGATADLSDAELDAVLATNVRAPHLLVAALAPAMAERGRGSIVNVGSWMARVGVPFGAAYTGSKAALEQMTRTWSAEFGPHGVGVTTVAPGATSTPGNADSADVLAAMTAGTVAGRPVRPVDVAFAVRWLVSGEAAFVHGSTVDVDGGIAATRLS